MSYILLKSGYIITVGISLLIAYLKLIQLQVWIPVIFAVFIFSLMFIVYQVTRIVLDKQRDRDRRAFIDTYYHDIILSGNVIKD